MSTPKWLKGWTRAKRKPKTGKDLKKQAKKPAIRKKTDKNGTQSNKEEN